MCLDGDGQQEMEFFTGGSVIMDYWTHILAWKQQFDVKKHLDEFVYFVFSRC